MSLSKSIRIIALFTSAMFSLVVTCYADGQSCEAAAIDQPSSARAYLQNPSDAAKTSECVEAAFRSISTLPQTEAITVLISYLGYKRPLTASEQNGIFLHGPVPDVLYPAVEALYKIGPPAEPALFDVLASDSRPDSVEASNALYTLLLIHHGNLPPIIKELTRRANNASDAPMSGRLHAYVKMLIEQCTDAFRQKCEDASRP